MHNCTCIFLPDNFTNNKIWSGSLARFMLTRLPVISDLINENHEKSRAALLFVHQKECKVIKYLKKAKYSKGYDAKPLA